MPRAAKTFEIDISPTTGMVAANRARQVSLLDCLCEVADNSWDAYGKNIELVNYGRTLVIHDDGIGCKDLREMLTPGLHSGARHKKGVPRRRKIGRFGVGLKDGGMILSPCTEVFSTVDGVRRHVRIDWEQIEQSGEWRLSINEQEHGSPDGTSIIFRDLYDHFDPISKKELDELAYRYKPMLEQGVKLIYSNRAAKKAKVAIEPWQLPKFDGEVKKSLDLGDGLKADLHVGLVSKDDGVYNTRPGLSVAYGPRIICQTTTGIDDVSGQLSGMLTLHGAEWKLSRNKTFYQVNKQLGKRLSGAIREHAKPLIEKAKERAIVVRSSALSALTESWLARGIKALKKSVAKERRDGGTRTGRNGVEGTGAGSPRRRASKTQEGDGSIRRSTVDNLANVIKVAWSEMGPDGNIGTVSIDPSATVVTLNLSHAFVKVAHANDNSREIGLMVLFIYVVEGPMKQPELFPGVAKEEAISLISQLMQDVSVK